MPEYVPSEECLDAIFGAARAAGLTRLPGPTLLEKVNGFAREDWPIGNFPECEELLGSPRSAALAFSLAMLWEPDEWNAAAAWTKFNHLREELLAAWAVEHTPQQKLNKTIGHAIVHGNLSKWTAAKEVLLYSIFGTPAPRQIVDYGSPIGSAIHFLRGGALPAGQVPQLDQCWGADFRDSASWHAMEIRSRLLNKRPPLPADVTGVNFVWPDSDDGDWLVAQYVLNGELAVGGDRVRAGSRRTYHLVSGAATLWRNEKTYAALEAGEKLILQMRDERKAAVWIPRGAGGPICNFDSDDDVRLVLNQDAPSTLVVSPCTCGTLNCDSRHRIDGLDPLHSPANVTFLSLLHTAVNGPPQQGQDGLNLAVNGFSTGMYYALLCDGKLEEE